MVLAGGWKLQINLSLGQNWLFNLNASTPLKRAILWRLSREKWLS